MSKLHYSYNQIHDLCILLANKIKKKYNPDVILAIGGGGFIPARIIRNIIDVPIVTLTINYYDKNNNITKNPNIVQWVDEELIRNKNVLIIDEIDDTRKTLNFIINKIDKLSSSLAIGVIHNKLKSKETDISVPYFSGEEIEDKWVVYPWDNCNTTNATCII